MRVSREVLSSKIRRYDPNLLDIHYIDHTKALVNDASSHFLEL